MVTKSVLGVEVIGTEIEIIGPIETSKKEDRIFGVGNGEKEIIAAAWGSDDGQNWVEEESKTIPPGNYKILVVGNNHLPHVKLIGWTTTPGETSVVDAYLTYTESAAP
ncbi:MAG: hypothetical protein ACFFDT_20695 [Candidatus Hodarchaeota archaeon]